MRPGNKQNSYLNGEWALHGRPWGKKVAAKRRRQISKRILKDELTNP